MTDEIQTKRALVSIVICAHNNWPDVEMTIESALRQSYQSLEVIVVDNSSTDKTPNEVSRRFGHSLRYTRQPNRGDAGAYNTGFSMARGEFIQFVDGDDILAPNKIEQQLKIFAQNPNLDIVYGDIRQFQTVAGLASWEDVATQPEDDILKAFIVARNGWTGIGVLGALFRRDALNKVGPWDEQLYISDLDYWLRAAWAGCQFGHCPESLMGFLRRRPGQMTANRAAMAHGEETVWDKALGYVTHEPYRSLIIRRLAEHRFHMAVSRDQMDVPKALAKLSLARTTDPKTVSTPAYAFGWLAIVLPGGSFVAQSPSLHAIRRFLARLVNFRKASDVAKRVTSETRNRVADI